ncbi:MAG: hypothetical protein ABI137_16445, partial [Antricoccus sp.]
MSTEIYVIIAAAWHTHILMASAGERPEESSSSESTAFRPAATFSSDEFTRVFPLVGPRAQRPAHQPIRLITEAMARDARLCKRNLHGNTQAVSVRHS